MESEVCEKMSVLEEVVPDEGVLSNVTVKLVDALVRMLLSLYCGRPKGRKHLAVGGGTVRCGKNAPDSGAIER